jgi:hypothetical protein
MLEELSGGRPAESTPPSWSAGTVSSPDDAGVFPPAGIPSYAPEPPPVSPVAPESGPSTAPAPPAADKPAPLPPLPAAPGSAYPTILPAGDQPEDGGRGRRPDRGDDAPDGDKPDRSKLLPLLVLAAVVIGGIIVLFNVLGGDDDTETPVPQASRPAASAQPSTQPTSIPTYSAAQIAQALEDEHFKHGYDAGKAKAASGAVSDPVATCLELGMAARGTGYPWGAHDRQGCLVGITS